MRFINYQRSEPPYDLFFDRGPRPSPGPGEVLVEVKAFGLNRADLLQRQGQYPPPPAASDILGLECSGMICELGQDVTRWKIGDEVCGLVDGGAYASYCAMDQGMIWKKPDLLSWDEAAAIPEAFLTAYQALFVLMDVTAMDHVLIHAAASGVGSAAIRLLEGIDIKKWGTASGAKKSYCLEAGYDEMIDYQRESFLDVIQRGTGQQGVNGIVDFVGASNFQDNLRALSLDGKMVMLGFLGGVQVEDLNIASIIRRRLHILGSTLRSRSREYKRELVSGFLSKFGDQMATGAIRPHIFQSLNWEEIARAHSLMFSNLNKGKIVLTIR